MKSTRPAIFLFLALFTLSCSNDEKPPVANTDSRNDTPSRPVVDIPKANSANPYATVDVSPMDMSYYPVEYPKLKMANPGMPPPVVRVIYSRPHLQGRHLFDDVLKYGEPWRLGANESTEIMFYRDVTIQDKKIKAGRYIIYCIPEANTWTVVFNEHVDSWGLKQEFSKDVQRFTVPSLHQHGSPSLEYFTIVFEKTATGADMLMAWGDVIAKLPIKFSL